MSRSRVLILPLLLVVLPACDWFGGDDADDPGALPCPISPREVTAVSFEQITFSAECPQPLFWTSWVDDPSEGSDAGIPPNFAVTVTAPQLAGTYEVYVRAMAYDLRDTATITVTERRDDVANRARISAHWSGSANFTDTTVTAWPGREALVLDDAFGFPSDRLACPRCRADYDFGDVCPDCQRRLRRPAPAGRLTRGSRARVGHLRQRNPVGPPGPFVASDNPVSWVDRPVSTPREKLFRSRQHPTAM